jgi:hypothetical protein
MIRVPVVEAWDISYLEAIKKLLHSSYFCQIISHLIIVAAVLFLYLFGHDLRVSLDEKSLNTEPLVFCNGFGNRKLNLNRVLQHITFGWDEHDVSSYPFQAVRPIEIHYPMIGQIINASHI